MTDEPQALPARRDALSWIGFAVAVGGVLVSAWAMATAWEAIVHGNPAYAILLAATLVLSIAGIWWTLRRRVHRGGWRTAGRIVLVVLAAGWLALTAWLRPYDAVEPALAAMQSDAAVTVSETATEIVLQPRSDASSVGVMFQPGALVDARAYAAVLRPLAEDGHTVVIAKQPFGIAFFAIGALDSARDQHPEIDRWVVGGHSLGGTVAAMEATADAADGTAPVAGLMLYASYPANDISSTLDAAVESISGTRDGLATPEKIDASRDDLPADTEYTVIEGASHAQFGDYGPQPGDNTPTISHDDARTQISTASRDFVDRLTTE
ncbi:alpha/beta hydrolase [Agromyces sp. MMS24-K17]|uniref:alpha/beta hydrolase n=1 Tax=Agromyces sp. MMS24-K17 TaxID=3372850 RepID=UPI003754D8BF